MRLFYDTLLHGWMRALKRFDKKRAGIEEFDPSAVKNILVVSSTAIGDTLLSTPAIRAVRKRYPEANIIAMFNRLNMDLFANNPYINGVIPYYGGYRNFRKTIEEMVRRSFDLAIIFHGNEPQATPLCYFSGAQFIFKLPNDSQFNFLLANREPVVKWKDLGHGIEARLKTAKLAGCEPDGLRMDLFLEDRDFIETRCFLENKGVSEKETLIGFQAGASTLSRQWFAPRFVELGKKVLEAYPDSRIILAGSPPEEGLCKQIAEGLGDRAVIAAGKLTLRQTAAMIKNLKVFVTGDTGPMHIAIALGTPIVALYAVADAKKTGPIYDLEKHTVIRKPRTCDPCVSKKCRYQKCMEAITPEEVFEAVKKPLGRFSASTL